MSPNLGSFSGQKETQNWGHLPHLWGQMVYSSKPLTRQENPRLQRPASDTLRTSDLSRPSAPVPRRGADSRGCAPELVAEPLTNPPALTSMTGMYSPPKPVAL